MNKKAEAFKAYLDKKKIEAFTIDEPKDDEQHTAVFRSYLQIEGQMLPVLVILDDSAFSMMRVRISPKARTEDNELAILRIANDKNMGYKPFKLYIDGEGSLVVDVCLVMPGDDFDKIGDEIYGIFDVLIRFLNENYRALMKEIW